MQIDAVVINASPLLPCFAAGRLICCPSYSSALWCRKPSGRRWCKTIGTTRPRVNCANSRGQCLSRLTFHQGLLRGHWVPVNRLC